VANNDNSKNGKNADGLEIIVRRFSTFSECFVAQ